MRKYTLEVIVTSVFGMSVDVFKENDIMFEMAEKFGNKIVILIINQKNFS